MAFDLKTATPDTSFPTGGFLFGADSQSATDPSIYTGKTVVSAAVADIEQTWNDAGTAFRAIQVNVTNTASNSGSRLIDLQVGGVTQFYCRRDGFVQFGNVWTTSPSADNKILGSVLLGTVAHIDRNALNLSLASGSHLAWTSSVADIGTDDVLLGRDGAGALGLRNGANAQTYSVYNTYTDASNYERLKIGWNANAMEIKPEAAGTGTLRVLHISGLPTSNPGAGILWNDAGTVKVGT